MIVHVKVRPGSREDKVIRVSDSDYEIRVKARPEKGKANNEVVKLLAQEFNVDKRQVIIKNPTSRRKIIEIIE
ncbi:hypothetical protein CO038_00355 [Candidatus Pacearchaeota archaeon CG_4_9_14_0_2_um_filter_39_13]|nr:DUF167 domain-containing protein [Candidatus Pacearchaeota archaeon]OIO42825.1 MAG: hypothetical protein AUJ64_03485 [Candidatus Pacearchaeota archaeon CG1_02_39_14]PJC45073.1 MAG: hypothetical protein CO038_00355 [Candidatus Pacearchaeota archaeon CG_4_9_14_0_2_um_filter_39_13]